MQTAVTIRGIAELGNTPHVWRHGKAQQLSVHVRKKFQQKYGGEPLGSHGDTSSSTLATSTTSAFAPSERFGDDSVGIQAFRQHLVWFFPVV